MHIRIFELRSLASSESLCDLQGHPVGTCRSDMNMLLVFDVYVTVHCFKFLIIKPTRYTNFSNLFLEWNSTCFGQFLCPSSGVFHCTHSKGICHIGLLSACEQEHMLMLASCQQTCMTYTISVCTVKIWQWTEELPETRRVSFQG